MRLSLVAVTLIFLTGTAHAGDLVLNSTERLSLQDLMDRPHCNFTLSGVVQPGDAEALRELSETTIPGAPPNEHTTVLCLDSPGGNFAEGVRLGHVIGDLALTTRVEAGDECISACAIAFLFGVYSWYDEWFNFRIMDVGARIGFHAPSLPTSGTDVPRSFLEDAYDSALSDLASLISTASTAFRTGSNFVLPPELLVNLLEVGSTDFYEISTIEQAIAYDVRLSFHTINAPQNLLNHDMGDQRLCRNSVRSLGLPSIGTQDISYQISHWGIPDPDPGWATIHIESMLGWGCNYSFNRDSGLFTVDIYQSATEIDRAYLPFYAVLPENTPIASLQ